MSLESRLKDARDHSKLSQPVLAEKIGVSPRSVAGYEKDASKIQLSLIYKIADICNVDALWLITGMGDMINGIGQSTGQIKTISTFDSVVENNIEITKKYEDYETALLANEYLVNMEKKSPKDFLLAVGYLKGVSDSIDRKSQDQNDRRKRTMDWASPERRKKTAS